jgi:hypothetical protein
VPEPSVNGIRVANGSALGLGIYTAMRASYSASYAWGTSSTIFVCAALTTGAQSGRLRSDGGAEVTVSGDVVVLKNEARVCPLFLLDFESTGAGCGRSSAAPPEPQEPPRVAAGLLRDMLRHAHAKARRDGLLTATALRSTAIDDRED